MDTSAWGLSVITTAMTAIALFVTGVGVLYVGKQLEMSRKIAAHQFMFQFDELLQQYNDLHIRLKTKTWEGPGSEQEWTEVSRYMGLFEGIQVLIRDRILDIETIDSLYGHRIFHIVDNKRIYERFIVERRVGWHHFIDFWEALRKQKVYLSVEARNRKLEKQIEKQSNQAL